MSLRESCGVYGVYANSKNAFPLLYWGMLAQNHRGHQSHGFAILNERIESYTSLGLIPVLSESNLKNEVPLMSGRIGIGNVRYATSASSSLESLKNNAMPVIDSDGESTIALSFNGNVVNIRRLQNMLGIDPSLSDAHVICRMILKKIRETKSLIEASKYCMESIDGSFSIVGLTNKGELFAFKDPVGVKPLCYGCKKGVSAFSSESVGLDINDINLDHELNPGEMMIIAENRVERTQALPCKRKAFCAFEFAYFARPDSKFNHKYVYETRRDFGVNLARKYSDIASRCDVVISLPETANDAAYGFHEESGLKWDMLTRRHRYVSQRAFITGVEERSNVIYRKVNILKSKIKGKRLAVVDDSIVRGDTTRSVVKRLRAAGAEEVHLFITFPKIIGPCFYGIDMASYSELIGAWKTIEEITSELGADSVNYQPIEDYVAATGMRKDELCLGCVTGEYPTPLANEMAKKMKKYILEGGREDGRIYESC
ncbi:amidophosphoribosyltransferase [Candidatus Bathyarchaeota archaeon]|nr:amidophosphoribosyltransferase [Candidatus Bathyarchaeota archaeon]MBS7630149.1 amidophosphoribosyltransferase [Candidatus Bathyarchaeota archaeon]